MTRAGRIEIRMPGIKCPHCRQEVDGASYVTDEKRSAALPPVGCFSICVYCGTLLVYCENPAQVQGLGLRLATPEEIEEIRRDPRLAYLATISKLAAKAVRSKFQ